MSTSFEPLLDFPAAAALGVIKGCYPFNIYGENTALIDSVANDLSFLAIANAGTVPLPPLSGEALEIVSDNIGDTDIILIEALGPNGSKLDAFTVTLNGTTPVALPGLISRLNYASSEGPAGFAGTISIQQVVGAEVYMLLLEGDQQSEQAIYTVPAGCKFIYGNLSGTMQKSGGSDSDTILILLRKRSDQTKWKRDFAFGLQRSGDTSHEFDAKYPSAAIAGPVDLKLQAEPGTINVAAAGFATGLIFEV